MFSVARTGPGGRQVDSVCYAPDGGHSPATPTTAPSISIDPHSGPTDVQIPQIEATLSSKLNAPVEEIGRGGMGIVFRYQHPELGFRAVKVLFCETPEASIAAEVNKHPNIVQVHSLYQLECGLHCIEMEFVPNARQLKDVIRDSHNLHNGLKSESFWRENRLLHFFRETLIGVDQLHQKKIVHRDIKPQNVLIQHWESPSEKRSALITDFGLSTRTGPDINPDAQHSKIFTVNYAAPEQVLDQGNQESKSSRISYHIDVFQLGVTLLELLVGQEPFNLTNSPSNPQGKIAAIKKAKSSGAQSPSYLFGDIDQLPIPKELAAIAKKALQIDPTRRYKDAGEMLEDLNRFLDQEVVHAYLDGCSSSVQRLMYKTRTAVASWKRAVQTHPLLTTAVVGFGGLVSSFFVLERYSTQAKIDTAAAQSELERQRTNESDEITPANLAALKALQRQLANRVWLNSEGRKTLEDLELAIEKTSKVLNMRRNELLAFAPVFKLFGTAEIREPIKHVDLEHLNNAIKEFLPGGFVERVVNQGGNPEWRLRPPDEQELDQLSAYLNQLGYSIDERREIVTRMIIIGTVFHLSMSDNKVPNTSEISPNLLPLRFWTAVSNIPDKCALDYEKPIFPANILDTIQHKLGLKPRDKDLEGTLEQPEWTHLENCRNLMLYHSQNDTGAPSFDLIPYISRTIVSSGTSPITPILLAAISSKYDQVENYSTESGRRLWFDGFREYYRALTTVHDDLSRAIDNDRILKDALRSILEERFRVVFHLVANIQATPPTLRPTISNLFSDRRGNLTLNGELAQASNRMIEEDVPVEDISATSSYAILARCLLKVSNHQPAGPEINNIFKLLTDDSRGSQIHFFCKLIILLSTDNFDSVKHHADANFLKILRKSHPVLAAKVLLRMEKPEEALRVLREATQLPELGEHWRIEFGRVPLYPKFFKGTPIEPGSRNFFDTLSQQPRAK